jgi:hypothetical protein
MDDTNDNARGARRDLDLMRVLPLVERFRVAHRLASDRIQSIYVDPGTEIRSCDGSVCKWAVPVRMILLAPPRN